MVVSQMIFNPEVINCHVFFTNNITQPLLLLKPTHQQTEQRVDCQDT